jgi:hypothetical protein
MYVCDIKVLYMYMYVCFILLNVTEKLLQYLAAGWTDEFAKKSHKMLPQPIFCPKLMHDLGAFFMKKVAQNFFFKLPKVNKGTNM